MKSEPTGTDPAAELAGTGPAGSEPPDTDPTDTDPTDTEPAPDAVARLATRGGPVRRIGRWLLAQLRTPADPASAPPSGPARQVTSARAVLTVLVAVVAVAVAAPLLLLTSWVSQSPATLAGDPAVQALQTYQHSLDGSPTAVTGLAAVRSTLLVRTLGDGSVKVSRVGRHGHCYYLVVPAQVTAPTSGVREGDPADCRA